MHWLEITVKTEQKGIEVVADILTSGGAGGVVIEDPDFIREQVRKNIWDAWEIPGDLLDRDFVAVKAYLLQDHRVHARLTRIKQRLEVINQEYLVGQIKGLSLSEVREEDWANSWKAYFKPVRIGRRMVVKPTWEEYDRQPGDQVIELDPGMAFGTGTHSTTIMCLKYLEQVVKGGETILDVGAGSGILSIAAALLGAGRIKAIDNDQVAVESARYNAALNKVHDRVEVVSGNLLEGVSGPVDIVVANIIADAVVALCPGVSSVLRPGGLFVASGIITSRIKEVLQACQAGSLTVRELARDGEWIALTAVREA